MLQNGTVYNPSVLLHMSERAVVRSVSEMLMSLRLIYHLIILYCITEQQQQQQSPHTIGQRKAQTGHSSGPGNDEIIPSACESYHGNLFAA